MSQKKILDGVIKDKRSVLYLSNNSNKIFKHLKEKGFLVPKSVIKGYILSEKNAPIIYKNRNEQKISQLSTPFIGRKKFFHSLHGDICVLSKNRSYFTAQYLILLLIDALSNKVFLEKISSTSFKHVSAAMQRIFDRCKYLPQKGSVINYDAGVEITSKEMFKWLSNYGMKLNIIRPRGVRGSKGSGVAEVMVRRFRSLLERYYGNQKSVHPLREVLPILESQMNREPQSVLQGLSANEALRHNPRYISMVKHSSRFRRRKYLKEQMIAEKVLPLYCIVRIVKFTKKIKFTKESYGSLSDDCYIVISKKKNDFVTSYTLGSLYSFEPLFDCTFTYYELKVIPISYPLAVYRASIANPGSIVSNENGMIEFKPSHSKLVYIATDSLFK